MAKGNKKSISTSDRGNAKLKAAIPPFYDRSVLLRAILETWGESKKNNAWESRLVFEASTFLGFFPGKCTSCEIEDMKATFGHYFELWRRITEAELTAPPRTFERPYRESLQRTPPEESSEISKDSDETNLFNADAPEVWWDPEKSARYLSLIEKTACHARALADHLVNIECQPSEVPDYLAIQKRTLVSLYFEACRPYPSPTELQRLAIRLGLDSRIPIEGDVRRFICSDDSDYCDITETSSPEEASLLAFEDYPTVRVEHFPATSILALVCEDPPSSAKIIRLIEELLGGRPLEHEGLQFGSPPRFTYQVTGPKEGQTKVQLWIGNKEVHLPDWKNVHNLLECLCKNAGIELSNTEAGGLEVTNLSQAAITIRKALEVAHPGAGKWLKTRPTRWAKNHCPRVKKKSRK